MDPQTFSSGRTFRCPNRRRRRSGSRSASRASAPRISGSGGSRLRDRRNRRRLGSEVNDVAVGDEVAALLPSLGGYGEYALAAAWTRKPPQVSWDDAAALPASVEAAVGVLRQLAVAKGETLLVLGAGGSV